MSKLKYELLLEEKGLYISDLPADAQRIITKIGQVKRGIQLNEGRGKKPSDKNIADLALQDKLAVREINEFLAEKNKPNPEEEAKKKAAEDAAAAAAAATKAAKDKADAEEAERKKKEAAGGKKEEEAKSDPKGVAIDVELQVLYKDGKESITLEELKKFAPNTYGVIFDTYDSGPNGIETSNYKIMETEKETFKISKAS